MRIIGRLLFVLLIILLLAAPGSCQQKATKPGTIIVAPAPLVVTSGAFPGATVGVPYSFTLVASGGTAPYTWSITVGTLPAGLSLTPGGVISGTPTTAGTFNFTYQVQDSSLPPVVKRMTIRDGKEVGGD